MDDLIFYILATIFQSYEDDGRVIMKDCAEEQHLTTFGIEKSPPSLSLKLAVAGSAGQCLTY